MSMSLRNGTSSRFASFEEFYAFYLSEHSNRTCRRLHFVGTIIVLLMVGAALLSGAWQWLLLVPLAGYGFAWIGHFIFEKNRPATFSHPWYSLLGDLVLFRDMLSGRIKF